MTGDVHVFKEQRPRMAQVPSHRELRSRRGRESPTRPQHWRRTGECSNAILGTWSLLSGTILYKVWYRQRYSIRLYTTQLLRCIIVLGQCTIHIRMYIHVSCITVAPWGKCGMRTRELKFSPKNCAYPVPVVLHNVVSASHAYLNSLFFSKDTVK